MIVLIWMSLHFNIWQLSQSEEEREFHHLFSEINHQHEDIFLQSFLPDIPTNAPQDGPDPVPARPSPAPTSSPVPQTSPAQDLGGESAVGSEAGERSESTDCHPRKKSSKPSPYHNFQKHLSVAVKHLLTPSAADIAAPPRTLELALALWRVFASHPSPSKKLLHFIFNDYNEYPIQPAELRRLGFEEIYRAASREELGAAKELLTRVGVAQLREERVEEYLEGRRIKNPAKFKRYVLLFRRELEEGFIKKRFTNRTRKAQVSPLSY